jgi:hypothetical protein
MKNLLTTKHLLPLFAAMMAFSQASKLKADRPDDDLYFGTGYDFTMDFTSLNPQASIFSPQYWSNISGLPAPDAIAVDGMGNVMGVWANGSTFMISPGGNHSASGLWIDFSAHMMPPDDTSHWGSTGIRG